MVFWPISAMPVFPCRYATKPRKTGTSVSRQKPSKTEPDVEIVEL